MPVTIHCQGCGADVEAESELFRLCRACRLQRRKQRWKTAGKRTRDASKEFFLLDHCVVMSLERVGRQLRMSPNAVDRVERMALTKLMANVRRGSLGDFVRARAASTALWLRQSGERLQDDSFAGMADEVDRLVRDMDRAVRALLNTNGNP